MAVTMDATFVARRTQEKDLVPFVINGMNHKEFNENWQEWVDFYNYGMFLKTDIPYLPMIRLKELKEHTGNGWQGQKCFCNNT